MFAYAARLTHNLFWLPTEWIRTTDLPFLNGCSIHLSYCERKGWPLTYMAVLLKELRCTWDVSTGRGVKQDSGHCRWDLNPHGSLATNSGVLLSAISLSLDSLSTIPALRTLEGYPPPFHTPVATRVW